MIGFIKKMLHNILFIKRWIVTGEIGFFLLTIVLGVAGLRKMTPFMMRHISCILVNAKYWLKKNIVKKYCIDVILDHNKTSHYQLINHHFTKRGYIHICFLQTIRFTNFA